MAQRVTTDSHATAMCEEEELVGFLLMLRPSLLDGQFVDRGRLRCGIGRSLQRAS